ncbi:unnamed protein product [Durusdinium trenchii]|uniref:Uncharacterized protein n=1 Tax=Durusdinium trenchii TaxID=1381693 RepID=A0ABP0I6L4_9DINO
MDTQADSGGDDVFDKIMALFESVVAVKNLGDYLQSRFPEPARMSEAIDELVMRHAIVPQTKAHTQLIPNASDHSFWLALDRFDYSPSAKSGFYPSNQQFKKHFGEFLRYGYKPHLGAIEVKFPFRDSTRTIPPHSVGLVDGFAKIVIMLSIVAMVKELELEVPRDSPLEATLHSFATVHCSYSHFQQPAHHFLYSLKMGFVTAEKLTPSPLTIVSDLGKAIELERAMSTSRTRIPLKDAMNKVIADFNRLVTLKRHRVDTARRNLAYNLLRCPAESLTLLHAHYDQFKHEHSALPHEILEKDFYVPNLPVRSDHYRGSKQLQQIMQLTPETVMLFFSRTTQDFARKVSKDASFKAKKMNQLDLDGQILLHDCCVLWIWVKNKMQDMFPQSVIDQHDEFFRQGLLDSDLQSVLRSGEDFDVNRLPFLLEAHGKTLETYVQEHQDKAKNALARSHEAAFASWVEDLKADQTEFLSEKILMEKEGAKTRAKLVRQLEECHTRAWDCVRNFCCDHLMSFAGKSSDAESTLMPSARSWLKEQAAELGNSKDDHSIVIFCICPAMGILSASRISFLLNFITNTLADHQLNGVCYLVKPNRAGQLESSRKADVKQEKDKDQVMKDEETKNEDAEESESEVDEKCKRKEESEAVEVRDVTYNLEKQLAMKDRNLKLRNVTWVFEPDTVYGRRDGVISGIAITHKNEGNRMRQTHGWKTGVVMGIRMCPRNEMYKPEVAASPKSKLPHMGRAMTDVQEMKQVAAGTSFVRETLKAFSMPTSKASLLVDMAGYDGFVALAALEEIREGNVATCATLTLDHSGVELNHRVANAVYEDARAGRLTVPSFPSFQPLLSALKSGQMSEKTKSFRVSAQRLDKLLVLEALAKKWLDNELTSDKAKALIDEHNKEFNAHGDYWIAEGLRPRFPQQVCIF